MREAAAAEDLARLREIEAEIGDFASASRELPVDLLLAYRDVSAWDDMVRCIECMPEETQRVQYQAAAEATVTALVERYLDERGILSRGCYNKRINLATQH